jgi:hypothetical protein
MTNTVCPICNIEHQSTVPTVHLNGTAAVDLLDQLQTAIDALLEGARALAQAAPNGRDYYVQGGSTIQTAMSAHARRCQEIDRTITELTEQRDHVQCVVDYKAAQRAERLAGGAR